MFRAHYATVLRLKSHFSFSIIDSMGTLEETKAQILRELRYQSSLDLATETYAAIRHLPLATDLVRESRQQLVSSLDRYYRRHTAVFQRVIQARIWKGVGCVRVWPQRSVAIPPPTTRVTPSLLATLPTPTLPATRSTSTPPLSSPIPRPSPATLCRCCGGARWPATPSM